VKQGSQAGFGIKDGEPFESNWDGDLDWLKPKFHTQDLSVRFCRTCRLQELHVRGRTRLVR
jgi:hypothetical protein